MANNIIISASIYGLLTIILFKTKLPDPCGSHATNAIHIVLVTVLTEIFSSTRQSEALVKCKEGSNKNLTNQLLLALHLGLRAWNL